MFVYFVVLQQGLAMYFLLAWNLMHVAQAGLELAACGPGWSGTCCIATDDVELLDPSASASVVLRVQA